MTAARFCGVCSLLFFLVVSHPFAMNMAFGQEYPCIQNPSNASCVDYTMPPAMVQEGIAKNCDMMFYMGGCTVKRICDTDSTAKSSPYCREFSILKDLCLDMPMTPCNNYSSMCSNVSVVQECKMAALPLPNTMWLSNTVENLCANMPDMPPCAKCPKKGKVLRCDLLQAYSDICMSMYMDGCEEWQNLCAVIPDWPICSSAGEELPMMKMYFHASILDYVLFKEWVPRNGWQYALTIVAIILFGMFYELLKVCRSIYEGYISKRKEDSSVSFMGFDQSESVNQTHSGHEYAEGSRVWKFIKGWNLKIELVRASMAFIETAVGLLLMLVAMTFNVGLFLAVCVGAFLGSLAFGRFANTNFMKHGCH